MHHAESDVTFKINGARSETSVIVGTENIEGTCLLEFVINAFFQSAHHRGTVAEIIGTQENSFGSGFFPFGKELHVVIEHIGNHAEKHIVREFHLFAAGRQTVIAVNVGDDSHILAFFHQPGGKFVPEPEIAVGEMGIKVFSRLAGIQREAVFAVAEAGGAIVGADIVVKRTSGGDIFFGDGLDDFGIGKAEFLSAAIGKIKSAPSGSVQPKPFRMVFAVFFPPFTESVTVAEIKVQTVTLSSGIKFILILQFIASTTVILPTL